MKRNKYLLLGSSLGALALLAVAAYKENFQREWRHIQALAVSDEGPVPVQLRQVVNPTLGISDRCVSCHVTMAPGEQNVRGSAVLAAHRPVVHDPAEFGCTVCHGGQGLATEKDDAHGDVEFWPQPMIPKQMAQAGCGTCHVPLAVPDRRLLGEADAAFERLDCLACHRVDGRGGTIRPGGGGMEGPDLTRTGLSGYDHDWYGKHLEHRADAAGGPWKSSFGEVAGKDLDLLNIYLATRIAAPTLVKAKAVFHSAGCLGCHKVGGVGGEDGPDLSRAGEKDPGLVNIEAAAGPATLANWMADHFRSPASLVVNSQMPAPAMPEEDIQLLTMYTLSLRRREIPGTYLPRDRVRASRFGEREFSADGATLFGAFCAGCHGPAGEGRHAPGIPSFPSIANPDFLRRAPDPLIIETIRRGRPGRRMPGWDKEGGLRPDEIDRLAAWLREMGGPPIPDPKPARWVSADAAAGKSLFETACSGCHGMNGQGGEGPALNNPVLLANATDTYLVETISRGRTGTRMAAFSATSPVHRTLAPTEIESIVMFLRSWEKPTGGKR